MREMTDKFFLIRSAILLTAFFVSVSFHAGAQENGEEYFDEDTQTPSYVRPDMKVFTSLRAAQLNPDSAFILVLKGKKLKQFPREVYDLPNLLVLDLSKNKLKSLPEDIGRMDQLIELDLTGNKLKVLPGSVGKLKSLKKLSLNRNLISELPPDIGQMKELEILELWDNEIVDLPPEISELKKLRILELRGILFNKDDHERFHEYLPDTRIFLSPPCNCQ
jgi:Leucine-rich repeat (LRR) protein